MRWERKEVENFEWENEKKVCVMVYWMSQWAGRTAQDMKQCRGVDILRESKDQESDLPPLQTDPIPD